MDSDLPTPLSVTDTNTASRNTPPGTLLALAALAVDRDTREVSIVRERHDHHAVGWILRVMLHTGEALSVFASPDTAAMPAFRNQETIQVADITEVLRALPVDPAPPVLPDVPVALNQPDVGELPSDLSPVARIVAMAVCAGWDIVVESRQDSYRDLIPASTALTATSSTINDDQYLETRLHVVGYAAHENQPPTHVSRSHRNAQGIQRPEVDNLSEVLAALAAPAPYATDMSLYDEKLESWS